MNKEGIDQNRDEWEERSLNFQDNLNSVLFKRFPISLNQHIHNFHIENILSAIPDQDELKLLDIGCGFGRNSIPLLQRNSKIGIVGVDISEHFVTMFKKNTNQPAFVGTIEELSEEAGRFDYILCITVLMYVEKEKIKTGMNNIFSCLKSDGKLILIEPLKSGVFFSSGFGLLSLLDRTSKSASENSFPKNMLRTAILENGGEILIEKRIPVTTIFIVPLYLLSKVMKGKFIRYIFRIVTKLDKLFEMKKLPSLYTSMIIQKKVY